MIRKMVKMQERRGKMKRKMNKVVKFDSCPSSGGRNPDKSLSRKDLKNKKLIIKKQKSKKAKKQKKKNKKSKKKANK